MTHSLSDLDQLAVARFDWTPDDAAAIYRAPFGDLIFAAQSLHRRKHRANSVQKSQLLSIKTGGCAEDCGYCSQSAFHETGLKASKLMPLDAVMAAAQKAQDGGATRFCMGAAWRSLKDRDVDAVCDMVEGVKSLGMETCVTLGMLEAGQAQRLKDAGLDFYNHNLDTSREYYGSVISTRTYEDRLDTLGLVREAGINVCCGGIIGMGESEDDRIGLLVELANLAPHPESVPINQLVAVPGTPLGDVQPLDGLDFVRAIATARIMMPGSVVRLSAGRETMSRELQALCFLAGAGSIFVGEELLTTPNPELAEDFDMFEALGLEPMEAPSFTGSQAAE